MDTLYRSDIWFYFNACCKQSWSRCVLYRDVCYWFCITIPVVDFFPGFDKWDCRHKWNINENWGRYYDVLGFVLFLGLMPLISEFLLDLVQDTWLSNLG